MSNIDIIASKLEDHYSILKYLKQNYPDILPKWKNKALRPQAKKPQQQPTNPATNSEDFPKSNGDDKVL